MKKTATNQVAVVEHGVCQSDIQRKILPVRGIQVMLDWELAELYGVETRVLNQAVKRNIERFPERFRFQLTKNEMDELITNCDKSGNKKHYPGTAAAFTEQGVAMLATVLRSPTAVAMSIRIMDAFVAMRHALASMAPVLARIEAAEMRQLEDRSRQITDQARNEKRFTEIFDAMNAGKFPPQKVFVKGQTEDAYSFVVKLVKKAKREIVLIDGYVNDVTLDILAKKRAGVNVIVSTHPRTTVSATDVAKFNSQYPTLTMRTTTNFHDRFLIIDGTTLYHVGGSFKDLGRLCFAIAELDAIFIPFLMNLV